MYLWFGDPIDYEHMTVSLRPGMKIERDAMLKKLINMQYSRNELDFKRGTFRAKGDIVEIFLLIMVKVLFVLSSGEMKLKDF